MQLKSMQILSCSLVWQMTVPICILPFMYLVSFPFNLNGFPSFMCLSDWTFCGCGSSLLSAPLVTYSLLHLLLSAFQMPKLVISQTISLMCTLYHHPVLFLHIIIVPSAQKKLYSSPLLHRNRGNFYSGHISHNGCPDKTRPGLIFKSLFPSRLLFFVTRLLKDSKVCHTKREQNNKVVLMF